MIANVFPPGSLPFSNIVLSGKKRPIPLYPEGIKTMGDHIRKARLDRGLQLNEVSQIMDVCSHTLSKWERNLVDPQIKFYPEIIAFLGYVPFDPPGESLAERCMYYRKVHGVSVGELAKMTGLCTKTIALLEAGQEKFAEPAKSKIAKFFQDPDLPDKAN